ncbi:hypothetical protein PV328_011706 [Microctonus aethiopoides]|uniref:Uncharacterized protein n=1 Tax=Microctonus aethiopoides TaxID=144406 RepID=A0AA39FHR5_9HYME|nr:hypothetical protein PV328_011706 [Microctonus aethiopoides]
MHVARPWIIIRRLRSSRSCALAHGIVADFTNYLTLVANILCSPDSPGSSYLVEQLQQSGRRGSANSRDLQSQQCRNPTQDRLRGRNIFGDSLYGRADIFLNLFNSFRQQKRYIRLRYGTRVSY